MSLSNMQLPFEPSLLPILERRLDRELEKRRQKRIQAQRGGLIEFVRYFWKVLEPKTPLIEGWPLEAICLHLEAVTFGELTRVLMNVPPGFMKSLLTDVLWPAWEWGPMNMPHLRYVAFSYAAGLTERDNGKFRDLLISSDYQEMWGNRFELRKIGETKVSNDKTGSKLATSVGGIGTGERGDRVICFPSDVRVWTDHGCLPIGEIVDSKLELLIAGYDELCDDIVWQRVALHESNPASDLVEIVHDHGALRCTPDHPIFVYGRGYIPATEIRPGDTLRILRDDHKAQTERDQKILFKAMPVCGGQGGGYGCQQSTLSCVRQDGLSAADAFGSNAKRAVLQPCVPRQIQQREKQSRVSHGTKNDNVRMVREGAYAQGNRGQARQVLLDFLRLGHEVGAEWQEAWRRTVRIVRETVSIASQQASMLLAGMCKHVALPAYEGTWKRSLPSRGGGEGLSSWVEWPISRGDIGARPVSLSAVLCSERVSGPSCASYRLCEREFGPIEPNHLVQEMSRSNARGGGRAGQMASAIVGAVRKCGHAERTFNLCVPQCGNYFADGVLVHNCDDPHNVKEGESETIRTETVRWFRESLSNRLNDMEKSAIVVIMQRVHEADVSGTILSEDMGYTHLMIPMQYDEGRHCSTSIGWEDPRTKDEELAWPARFPKGVVSSLESDLGPYAFAAQYAQAPVPRGGGIFKREWWKLWESTDGKFPLFEYIVASLDSAFTEKEENDPSGFTVWGIWTDPSDNLTPDTGGKFWRKAGTGRRKVMLIHAWRKHLEMHGEEVPRKQDESYEAYVRRSQPKWGLVEWVAHTCRRFKVDKLLIEAKASGITAAQEMQRLYGTDAWVTQLEKVIGDKVARAHAVVPAWSQGLIYAPDRDWADLVIEEMSTFNKGRYDDLTDSSTQAIKHLRQSGLIQHEHERVADENRAMTRRKKKRPLYPA